MHKQAAIVVAALVAASLPAQNHLELPATATPQMELNDYELVPFQQPNARVQMFYGASEVGTNPVVLDEMAWRYDGPIPQVGAPGPFTIQQFVVRVGKTAIAHPGADFEANLTEPLTEVFNGPWTYLPDQGSAFPHPWGGPNDSLVWPFSTPVPVQLNAGEWLVVDVTMVGNNIASFGFAHAIVDGALTSGGVADGTSASFGVGCAAGAGLPNATASVQGVAAPGAAHFLTGQHLGSNAIALGMFGLDDQSYLGNALPFQLPATACSLLTSIDATRVAFADASGAVAGEAMALDLPADPAINGVTVYEQFASLVPAANPWGLVFSDAVAVTLGTFTPPASDYYMVAHDTDAGATYANLIRPFGYAVRFVTL